MAEQFLFVYGTLRRKAGNRTFAILGRFAAFEGEARYQGRLYDLGAYPGVVPSDNPDDLVRGEVYRLYHPHVILPRLDRYEGCGPGFVKPTEYVRDGQPVCLSNGDTITAWVYLYNRPVKGLKRIASGDYVG